jgi:hypothetical protein
MSRFFFSFLFVFVFVFAISAQQPRLYRGEPHVPYIFEPYLADYVYKGVVAGVPLKFMSSSTRITELKNEWQEDQKIALDVLDFFPADDERDEFRNVEITSRIDLATGLLRSLSATFGDRPNIRVTANFSADGSIVVTGTDGKRTKQQVYTSQEKIYPCTFSNAFLSYLPLNDGFAGTFTCVDIDAEKRSSKDALKFTRRTLRVVGTERVTVPAGTFDCYKLSDEAEELKYNADGSIKEKRPVKLGQFDEEKLWKNVFSGLWIDKASRKLVKAELNSKIGSIVVELQPVGRSL